MRGTGFTSSDAERLYNIGNWGAGHFGVDDAGRLNVCAPDGQALALTDIVAAARDQGLRLPLLLRFDHILHHRVNALCGAFNTAIAARDYGGHYTAVYPIKVNQQAAVIKQIVAAGGDEARVGLEAGSKPELMAVLGLLPAGRPIVCNGYKDRDYVRLGLLGEQLGHPTTLVIEKLGELEHVFSESHALGVRPHLGLRARLANVSAGHWQNTGGEKSKFGLSAGQVRFAVEQLHERGMLDCLHLLHFHLGSQVANLRDIRAGLREAARYYVALREMGAPIDTVDIGGGLGVDYEGTRSRSYCSMNYTLEDYARTVVDTLAEAAHAAGQPEPHIISESGRALTAHHAVLITNVIDCEPAVPPQPEEPAAHVPHSVQELWALYRDHEQLPPLERIADAATLLDQVHAGFALGDVALAERALAEDLHTAIGHKVLNQLDPGVRAHRDTLDELREKLADKFFCNFSVFQSVPDVWAIDQVFPIVPIQRLHERPGRRALIRDLTCDSDGRIDHYVDRDGVESSLPVHDLGEGEDYLLGLFLVGAYQEILGDMHNLFGDTDAANVSFDAAGNWALTGIEHGDRVDELLAYVHLSADELHQAYSDKLAAAALTPADRESALAELAAGLGAYTYLSHE